MENNSDQNLNFLDYYQQTKQRVDLEVELKNRKVIWKTKLTLNKRENINLIEDSDYYFKINAENMFIKEIYLKSNTRNNNDLIKLNFQYIPPNLSQFYIKTLYTNIEDVDSYRNLNRIEWENRVEGNLEIKIGKNSITSHYNIFKIIIEYELISPNPNLIGIIFQNFYDEKMDLEYDICYTPNFYFNTCNWLPCIYSLKTQLLFKLYLIVPEGYSVYSSCQLNCVYQDTNKMAFYYKTKEPISNKNIGFIITNDKIHNRIEDPINKNILYIINESKKEKLDKNLIQNGLIHAIYNFYDEFFESDVNTNVNTFLIFIPYLNINSNNNSFSSHDENYFNLIKFPNLYILPEKLIYIDN